MLASKVDQLESALRYIEEVAVLRRWEGEVDACFFIGDEKGLAKAKAVLEDAQEAVGLIWSGRLSEETRKKLGHRVTDFFNEITALVDEPWEKD